MRIHEIKKSILPKDIDESKLPSGEYDLVYYRTPKGTRKKRIISELDSIKGLLTETPYIWVAPDEKHKNKRFAAAYVTTEKLPCPMFLGLMKNCRMFISNSPTALAEARFLLKEEQIISV